MSTITDLVALVEANKLVFNEQIPNIYWGIIRDFRVDISPTGVTVVKGGRLIDDIKTDFDVLVEAVQLQITTHIENAKVELRSILQEPEMPQFMNHPMRPSFMMPPGSPIIQE